MKYCFSATCLTLFFFGLSPSVALGQASAVEQDRPRPEIRAKRPERQKDARSLSTKTFDLNDIKKINLVGGVVENENGDRLAGVNVELFGLIKDEVGMLQEQIRVGQMETAANGAFRFEDLQTKFETGGVLRVFVLMFRKPGMATSYSNSILWKKDSMVVVLKRPGIVKGVVRNDVGEPVAGVDVSFYSPLKDRPAGVMQTVSKEDGTFEIRDFHKMKFSSMRIPLNFRHPDYGKVGLEVSQTPNFFKVTLPRAAKFVGRVLDPAGKPVANCQLSLQSFSGEESHIWEAVLTKSDGTFSISKIPNVKANLFFKTESLMGAAVPLAGTIGSKSDLGDLQLQKPVIVNGTIIDDATGKPMVIEKNDFYGVGWHGPERPSSSTGVSMTQVKQDGTFKCRFLPGMNYPYVASGSLEVVGKPYPNGVAIDEGIHLGLVFRVKKRNKPGRPN